MYCVLVLVVPSKVIIRNQQVLKSVEWYGEGLGK